MTGVLHGGWEFVWAAYGISAVWLSLYGLSLYLRSRAEKGRKR